MNETGPGETSSAVEASDPAEGVREPGAKRAALLAIAGSSAALALAYGSAFWPGGVPGWAPWLFMAATSVTMVATMALGAARGGRIGALWVPFGLVLVVLLGGFGLALALPPAVDPVAALWLGLPRGAAIVVYGVGLVPYLLVPVAYAWTFDRLALTPADVERVREEALAARSEVGARDG